MTMEGQMQAYHSVSALGSSMGTAIRWSIGFAMMIDFSQDRILGK